ncbi:hypothetical protein BJ165DRAFT_1072615 [Panaeolus papilionaceus]|nr:hypothetical protein BJ165DRAFT_1072615 [Panaeolus papilionaceus]
MPIVPLTCLTCGLTFSTVGLMGMHCLTMKHIRLPFCCFRCGIGFSDEASMKEHADGGHAMPVAINLPSSIEASTPDGSTPGLITSDRVSLVNSSSVWPEFSTKTPASATVTIFVCTGEGCNASFTDKAQFRHHIATVLKSGHFFCSVCSLVFKKESNLTKHMHDESHLRKSTMCPFCDETFAIPAQTMFHVIGSGQCLDKAVSMQVREQVVAQIKTRRLWCYVCNTIFSKRGLRRHLPTNQHIAACNTCPFCKRVFSRPEQTVDHVAKDECKAAISNDVRTTTQEQLKAYTIYCSQCPTGFADQAMLYQHYAAGDHFWCFVCSQHYQSPSKLSAHLLRSPKHALNGKSCPFCSLRFGDPSATARHLSSQPRCAAYHHGMVGEYVLGVTIAQIMPPGSQTFVPASTSMAASFQSPSIALSSSHQSSPSNIPTYTNSAIKYTANQASFNGRAYVCFLCQKSFKKLPHLNSHLQSSVHKGTDDSFSCPKCNRTFRELSGMVQHIESGTSGFTMPRQVIDHVREFTAQYAQHRLTL